MIPEKLIQYIWQNKLFCNQNLRTCSGEELEIIDIGRLNNDAGPDFFNAKVKICDKIWAGNVEIHQRSSDWKRHHHSADSAYDNVILHVVIEADDHIYRKNGEEIPQLVLTFSKEIIENCSQFIDENRQYPCAEKLSSLSPIFVSSWMSALLTERLMNKSEHIDEILQKNKNNWSESFYIALARSFGFGVNGDEFERLAKSVPLSALQKHKNNLLQIEAMLFGVAGLLPENPKDEYAEKLCNEAHFLMTKFNLATPQNLHWKMARMRPQNFPQVRIAQFAKLIFQSSKLFSKIVENPTYASIYNLFDNVCADGYWSTHCNFSNVSPECKKCLGKTAIHTIMINCVVPFLFSYAKQKNDDELREKSLSLLEEIPAESNRIVEKWQQFGIEPQNAYDSQAVIELQKMYCDRKDCLRCRIAHKIISTKKE